MRFGSCSRIGQRALRMAQSDVARCSRGMSSRGASALLPHSRLQSTSLARRFGAEGGLFNRNCAAVSTSRASTSSRVPRTVSIRSISMKASSLRRLESVANRSPDDADAQAEYLFALNSAGYHSEVVRRVQSGQFASNNVSDLEAIRAKARMDYRSGASSSEYQSLERMHQAATERLNSSGMGRRQFQSYEQPRSRPEPSYESNSDSNGSSGGAGGGQTLGTPDSPLHMQFVQSGFDRAMRLIQGAVSIAFACFLAYTLYSVGSGLSQGKGGGGLQDLLGERRTKEAKIPDTRFSDVRGAEEAREELEVIVKFLKDPSKFAGLGAKIPRGVLLVGPPGTGKTLLARAVAGEAGCKFYSASGSEFEEVFVGRGARRVRDLFEEARKNAPSIVFIDEVDAVGAKRDRFNGGSQRQTLNQMLASMDGFEKSDNVVVVAATNDPDSLDSALVRPGRFDTKVQVPLPSRDGRRDILEYYIGKVKAAADVDAQLLSAATPGMSGAQIEAMINEAAILASKRGAEEVDLEDIEEARDKVWMGPALRSRKQTERTKRITAYHEAGHTLTALLVKHESPLHKVTIVPRGNAGGVTFFLEREESFMTRKDMLNQLAVAMGGRVAEEIIFGRDDVTQGAMGDLQQATSLARNYVKRFGLSEGLLAHYNSSQHETRPSSAIDGKIDEEVEKLLREARERVVQLLTTDRPKLELLAQSLLKYETLTAEEVHMVIGGQVLPPPEELVEQRKQRRLQLMQREAQRLAKLEDERNGEADVTTKSSAGGWGLGSVFGSGSSSSKKKEEAAAGGQAAGGGSDEPPLPGAAPDEEEDDEEGAAEGSGGGRRWD